MNAKIIRVTKMLCATIMGVDIHALVTPALEETEHVVLVNPNKTYSI